EVLGQAVLEGIALFGPVLAVVTGAGHLDLERGDGTVLDVEPVVVAPIGFLDRGLSAEDAAAFLGGGAAAEVDEVSLALGGLDEVAMAGALDGGEGGVLGG